MSPIVTASRLSVCPNFLTSLTRRAAALALGAPASSELL